MTFSPLDPGQIIKTAFNDTTGKIKVEAEITQQNPPMASEIVISAVDDSIKIGDGLGHFLAINADGSLNVESTSGSGTPLFSYGEATNVASGVETAVITYVVPGGSNTNFYRIMFSGDNIAAYQMKVNGATQAKKYTCLSQLSDTFEFAVGPGIGVNFSVGTVISLTVLHSRPTVGSFNATIQGLVT